MFVFDKRLSPEQAINFKASSKAPFGFMPSLTLAVAGVTTANINCTDPTLAADATAGLVATDASGTAKAVGLLTRVRWDLGATDPVCLEGLITLATRQVLVGLLYAGLSDITVKFGARVFEYDPVIAPKVYYAAFDTGITTPLTGKLLKDGDRELAIELGDDEALNIQDNSFYSFSMKIAPALAGQTITLASQSGGKITKLWGRTA